MMKKQSIKAKQNKLAGDNGIKEWGKETFYTAKWVAAKSFFSLQNTE